MNEEILEEQEICSYSADYREIYSGKKNISGKSQYISLPAVRSLDAERPYQKENYSDDTDFNWNRYEENYRDQELNRKRRKKFPGNLIRVLVISIFLAAGISCIGAATQFFCEGQAGEKLRYYDNFIWPVVMQDPEPFGKSEEIDGKMILRAAVWKAAVQKNSGLGEFDNMGRLILPQAEVEEAVKDLFDRSIDIESFVSEECGFYKYDQAQSRFYVEAVSADQCFYPHTVSFRNEGQNIILDVEYITPENQFNTFSQAENETKAEKYMQYVISRDKLSHKEYISAVKNVV